MPGCPVTEPPSPASLPGAAASGSRSTSQREPARPELARLGQVQRGNMLAMAGRVARLDAAQRRNSWLGFPLAVLYKYFEDQGTYLAALMAYYGLVSLFPLLLLLATLVGFVLHGHPGLQRQMIGSVLSRFPVVGSKIGANVGTYRGSGIALGVSIVGSLYGGLGLAQSVQNGLNRAWGVPRYRRPDPLHSRMRSLSLLPVMGLGVLLSTGLSTVSTSVSGLGGSFDLRLALRAGFTVLATVANVGLLVIAFKVLTALPLRARQVLPGAIFAGVGWQVLQELGSYYIDRFLRGSSALYGLFAVLLGLLAWIFLEAIILVLGTEVNVVVARRLWPRALLILFSDKVDLTDADRRAYQGYARTERYRGFVEVEVDLDEPHEGAPRGPTRRR